MQWLLVAAVTCVGSRIALKMCDLSAHAYRTSSGRYVHTANGHGACAAVACADLRLFYGAYTTYLFQYTIGPYTNRIPFFFYGL